jgi:hypothetical protein
MDFESVSGTWPAVNETGIHSKGTDWTGAALKVAPVFLGEI